MNRWARWLQANGPGRFQLDSKTGRDVFVHTAAREPLQQLTCAEMARLTGEELEDYTEARMVWNANLPTVRRADRDPGHRRRRRRPVRGGRRPALSGRARA